MAIHTVFIRSRGKRANAVDKALRQRFDAVCRVGDELWLLDTGHDSETVARLMRALIGEDSQMFIAAMTRDVVPVMSDEARTWLTAPHRSWRAPRAQHEVAAGLGPLTLAA